MINTAACLVRAHLAFCTSRCQTMIFADLKAGLIILCRQSIDDKTHAILQDAIGKTTR